MLSRSFSSNLWAKRKFPVPGLVDVVSRIGRLLCFWDLMSVLIMAKQKCEDFWNIWLRVCRASRHSTAGVGLRSKPVCTFLYPAAYFPFLVYSLQKYAKRQTTSIMTTLLDLSKSVAQKYEKESNAKRNDSLMLKITFVLTLVWSTNKSSLSS